MDPAAGHVTVPGTWGSVRGGDAGWLALRADNTWWWGRGAETHEITGPHDVPPYLAEISDTGALTRTGPVPNHDDVLVSPGGAWLTWTAPGTTGGEVTSVAELQAQSVDGGQPVTLTAPAGWGFRTRAWAWESDEHLVSPVVGDGDGGERMARCSVQLVRCVLVDSR